MEYRRNRTRSGGRVLASLRAVTIVLLAMMIALLGVAGQLAFAGVVGAQTDGSEATTTTTGSTSTTQPVEEEGGGDNGSNETEEGNEATSTTEPDEVSTDGEQPDGGEQPDRGDRCDSDSGDGTGVTDGDCGDQACSDESGDQGTEDGCEQPDLVPPCPPAGEDSVDEQAPEGGDCEPCPVGDDGEAVGEGCEPPVEAQPCPSDSRLTLEDQDCGERPCPSDDELTVSDEICPEATTTTEPFRPVTTISNELLVPGGSNRPTPSQPPISVRSTVEVSDTTSSESSNRTVRGVIGLLVLAATLMALLTWRYWWITNPVRRALPRPKTRLSAPPAPARPFRT